MKGTTASADTTQPAASTDQTVTTVDVPAVVVTDPAAGATVDISSRGSGGRSRKRSHYGDPEL